MIASLLSMFGLDGGAFNPLGNYKTALYAIAIVDEATAAPENAHVNERISVRW